MSDYKLYEGINNIDDDLIEEADRKATPIIRKYYSFAAAAAVVVLAFGAAGWGLFHKGNELLDKDKHDVNVISEEVTTTSVTGTDIICTTASEGHNSIVTTVTVSGKKQTTVSETAADADRNTTGSGQAPKVTTYTVTKKRDSKTNHSVGNNAVTTTHAKANVNYTTTRSKAENKVTTALTTMPAPVVTTDVTTQPQYSELDMQVAEFERSIFMKKYLASLAAAATLVNYVPTGLVQADYHSLDESDYIASVYLSDFESGKAITDVNNDGVFDRNDLVPVYSYLMKNNLSSDEEKAMAVERGDANLSGSVKMNDYVLLARYYLLKYGINADDFNMYNYKDKDGNVTLESYQYVNQIRNVAIEDGWAYKYESDLINNGVVNVDFNGSGTFDIMDIFEYSLYTTYYIHNPFNESAAKAESILSDTSWNNCKNYMNNCFFDYESVNNLMRYYLSNNEFDIAILNSGQYKKYADELIKKLVSSENIETIKRDTDENILLFTTNLRAISVELGLIERENRPSTKTMMGVTYSSEEAERLYKEYEEKVLNGTVAPPDVNFDGHCNHFDLTSLNEYWCIVSNNMSMSDSALSEDTFTYIKTQFDINNNGISGDGFDIMEAMDLINEYTKKGSIIDLDSLLAVYNAKNGVSSSDAQKKELSEVEHIKFLESFSSEPIRRSGDANNSGSVNMADAVTILCSCCNPDEYALTEWGEFNADVNNTGDGITPGDAAKIQRRLVGIEK